MPSSALIDSFADVVCDEDSLPQLCESIMFLLCGFDSGQANLTLIDTIIHHTPAGSSSKTLVHYGQEMASGNSTNFYYTFGKPLTSFCKEHDYRIHFR